MSGPVFTVSERNHVRDLLIEKARTDPRIVAGAVVGAEALGGDDRWSDIDLTFGIAEGAVMNDVISNWTAYLQHEARATVLFDLPYLTTMYRVFLLPGNLQVDLSFTPKSDFGALGPKFKLLFGEAVQREPPPKPSAGELFGIGVHHAVRARYCLERGRPWQAEYWISGVRDQALALACSRRGLEAGHGRGFDRLPTEVLDLATAALVRSPEREELVRALSRSIDLLVQEADEARDLANRLRNQLRDIVSTEWSSHH